MIPALTRKELKRIKQLDLANGRWPFSTVFAGYVKVYALTDPNGNYIYVGITTLSLKERLDLHIRNAKSNEWESLKEKRMLEVGIKNVGIMILEQKYVAAYNRVKAKEEMYEREQYWIRRLFYEGADLTNNEVTKLKNAS